MKLCTVVYLSALNNMLKAPIDMGWGGRAGAIKGWFFVYIQIPLKVWDLAENSQLQN